MQQKLLMATDKFSPHPGGSAVVMGNWCNRWPADRVRVVTAWCPGAQDYDSSSRLHIQRVRYPDIPKVRMPILWIKMWARLVHTCRRFRPTTLHYGQLFGTSFMAPWLKRTFRIPYVTHIHGEELTTSFQQPFTHSLYRWVLSHSDGATANSSFTEQLLRDRFGYSKPILRVHPGVDSGFFVPGDRQEAREQLGVTGQPVLLTVSRLAPRKGHLLVIETLNRLRVQFPDVTYLIVGEGPERPAIEQAIDRTGLGNHVRLLGKLPLGKLKAAYQASDVFVHPNRAMPNGDVEGFGIVFLEAAACEVPVIGGRSGGTVDAVRDGNTGFLIDAESPSELLFRLRELLENRRMAREMGAAGRVWAAGFSWEEAARRVWHFTGDLSRCGHV